VACLPAVCYCARPLCLRVMHNSHIERQLRRWSLRCRTIKTGSGVVRCDCTLYSCYVRRDAISDVMHVRMRVRQTTPSTNHMLTDFQNPFAAENVVRTRLSNFIHISLHYTKPVSYLPVRPVNVSKTLRNHQQLMYGENSSSKQQFIAQHVHSVCHPL